MSICQLLLCSGAWRVLLLDPLYSAVMMAELNCAWPSVFLSPQLQQRDVCGWWKLVPLRVCSGFRWARLSHKWVLDDAWSSWLSALLMCNTSLQKQTELERNAQSSHPISQPSGQNANDTASTVLAFCSADVHGPSGETFLAVTESQSAWLSSTDYRAHFSLRKAFIWLHKTYLRLYCLMHSNLQMSAWRYCQLSSRWYSPSG